MGYSQLSSVASPASVVDVKRLTKFTSGQISRLDRLLITPDHHVQLTLQISIAQKYSMEKMKLCFSFTGHRSWIPKHLRRTRSPLSYDKAFSNELYYLKFELGMMIWGGQQPVLPRNVTAGELCQSLDVDHTCSRIEDESWE